MSIIDQAFIRAYQEEAAPKIAARPEHAPAPQGTAPQAAPPSAAQATSPGSQNLPTAEAIDTYRLDIGHQFDLGISAAGTSPSSSMTGSLRGVVPPPHAVFAMLSGSGSAKNVLSPGQIGLQSATPITPHTPAAAAPTTAPPKNIGGHGLAAPHATFGPSSPTPSPMASLSSFTGLTPAGATSTETPKPALEVDAVRWPAICETLLARHAERFDGLAAELRRETESGHKVTAISGTRHGEGRSTMALCLARRLALLGTRLVLVDADFATPSLVERLGIGVARGWESVLAGDELLWEVMIESVADRLALLPLAATVNAEYLAGAMFRLAATLHELADHYEVVLVDAGPLAAEWATQQSNFTQWLLEPSVGVQGIILAHDVRHGEPGRLAAGCLQLADARQRQLGIAEMFVGER